MIQRTLHSYLIACAILCSAVTWRPVHGMNTNYLPRFVDSFAAEIVVRVKEGPASMQNVIYHLKGEDADGDKLTFGVLGPFASEYISIEQTSPTEADVFLRKELDRETRDSYSFVLTLTDGKLGKNNFITKSMLIIVEDINDNEPVFRNFRSTLTLSENTPPGTIIDLIEAVDADEGRFGQVLYHLREVNKESDQPDKFSIETRDGKGLIKLVGPLDYETKSFYQLKITATDRAVESQQKSSSVILLIKVDDAEDEPPVFTYVPSVTRIAENLPAGSEVFRVRAVDGDRGLNKLVTYRLTKGPHDYFAVNPMTGIVTLKRKLDRELLMTQHADLNLESRGSFIIQITATEVTSNLDPQPNAIAEVTAIVTDINDERPQFIRSEYAATIAENSQPGTPVTFSGDPNTARVYDYDQGKNGTFALYIDPTSITATPNGHGYQFDQSKFKDMFTITPTVAINEVQFMIRVDDSSALDFEKIKSISLNLVAIETVLENPQSSTAKVVINLVDVNDNAPQFDLSQYHAQVPENATSGLYVTSVKATDADTGMYGTQGIRYTNLTGEFAPHFHLDPITGAITVRSNAHKLDREKVPEFYLTVEAADDGGRGNKNHVQVAISVTDVNDNRPRFLQDKHVARITENQMEFQTAVLVTAIDDDQPGSPNSQLRYTITAGDPDNHFAIDSATGRLKVRKPLDFERIVAQRSVDARDSIKEEVKNFTITVRASDYGSPPLWADVPVTVYVFDENDNTPLFVRSHYYKSIPEDIRDGSMVLQVQATDADGSPSNSKVFYRIISGAADKFVIDPNTGVISVANGASLDPDRTSPKRNNYLLNVVAIDHGFTIQRSSQTTVNITVVDVNNKPPELINHPGFITIPENSPKDMFVTRVAAIDPDESATLKFYINYNRSEAYNEDGQLLDNPSYLNAFKVDPDDGTIRIAGDIDREKCELVKLNLVVQDTAASTQNQLASAMVAIKIGDVNDERPTFRRSVYRAMVTENSIKGTPIITITADDRDLSKAMTYTLKGPQEIRKLVSIDEKTGAVTVADKIDRETIPWINLTVVATDTGSPPLSGTAGLHIKVLDENDNNPYFVGPNEGDQVEFYVREDTSVGSIVGHIKAMDPDEGAAGKVTYLLDGSMVNGKFRIDRENGVLTVANPLDREERSEYRVIVEAWDNFVYGHDTGESRRAFKQVVIYVTDFNDNVPVLDMPNREECIQVSETVSADATVTTLKATDADDPLTENSRVKFELIGDLSQDRGLFELQQVMMLSNGIDRSPSMTTSSPDSLKTRTSMANVITKKSLRGYVGNYTVTIRLQDHGAPALSSTSKIKICVTDVNDHPPVFIKPPTKSIIKVPENATLGSVVVAVEAKDEDYGDNAEIRYRFKAQPSAHHHAFHINEQTGIISLKSPLDRERQKIYELRIVATDLGSPSPLSSDLDLTVLVTDVDDSLPEFTKDRIEVTFSENQPPGKESHEIIPTVDRDEDYEDSALVRSLPCYYLVGGHGRHRFSLDRFSHHLTTKEPLDREEQANYTLIVKATSDCFRVPRDEFSFDPQDNTLLSVSVVVGDVNDSPPKFTQEVFTGGLTTATEFASVVTEVRAIDPDDGINGQIEYLMAGDVQIRLTSGQVTTISGEQPFLLHNETGEIWLNFVPQPDMAGMFEFDVIARDPLGLRDPDRHSDRAKVKIYLLKEDQRVRFTLRLAPHEFREKLDRFRKVMSAISGATVSVDSFKYHENKDGSVDHKKTSLLTHFVDPNENEVLDVNHVLSLIDKNEEHLDELYKEFNVLLTEPAKMAASQRLLTDYFQSALVMVNIALILLLFMIISICRNQKARLDRQLKAATATAFGGTESRMPNQNAPNTNQHSVEGSNPMWLSAYGTASPNPWYNKQQDDDDDEEQHNMNGRNGRLGGGSPDSEGQNSDELNTAEHIDEINPHEGRILVPYAAHHNSNFKSLTRGKVNGNSGGATSVFTTSKSRVTFQSQPFNQVNGDRTQQHVNGILIKSGHPGAIHHDGGTLRNGHARNNQSNNNNNGGLVPGNPANSSFYFESFTNPLSFSNDLSNQFSNMNLETTEL